MKSEIKQGMIKKLGSGFKVPRCVIYWAGDKGSISQVYVYILDSSVFFIKCSTQPCICGGGVDHVWRLFSIMYETPFLAVKD